MEASSGKVLLEYNPDTKLFPASVTKIMATTSLALIALAAYIRRGGAHGSSSLSCVMLLHLYLFLHVNLVTLGIVECIGK